MTIPTRFGRPAAMIGGRLGVIDEGDSAPPAPDCCAIGETPPDRLADANGGTVFGLAGEDTITYVQTKAHGNADTDATIAVTLDAAPTLGNILVAVYTVRDATVSATTPAGWTRQELPTAAVSDGGQSAIYWKAVGVGESATLTITKNEGKYARLSVSEFGGVGFEMSDHANAIGASTSLTAGPLTPTSPTLLFAMFIQAARTATYTWPGPWVELDDANIFSAGPSHTLGYRIVDPSAGAYSVTVTSTESDIYGWGMLAFLGSAPDWILPLPLVNDEDDATYETITATEVARADVGAPFRIAQSRLRIGTQFAGSKTYTITGATLPDMSDGVVLATVTFTGLGSYTAQDVDFGWEPVAEYEYFQLDGTGETRRIYAWELREQDPGEVYVTDPTTDDVTTIQVALDNIYNATGATPPVGGRVMLTAGNYTGTTGSFGDVTGATLTITTLARRVRIGVVGAVQVGAAADAVGFDIDIDGVREGGTNGLTGVREQTASHRKNFSFTHMSGVLSAGSHTFKLQSKRTVGSGTITILAVSSDEVLTFWVEETLLTT